MPNQKFYGKSYHDLIPKIRDQYISGNRLPKAMPALPKPQILPAVPGDEPETDYMIGLTDLRKEKSYPTGRGLCAVVIDTGVAENKFLNGKVYRTTVNADKKDIDDKYGHGTHMAGIIAAQGSKISGMGIAPDAKILSIKVSRKDSGESSWANIYEALKKVLNLVSNNSSSTGAPEREIFTGSHDEPELRISVVNLSFNGLDHITTSKNNSYHKIIQTIKKLEECNVPVVISSGNDFEGNFRNGLGYPACGTSALHVGATVNFPFWNENLISTFSQRLYSDNSRGTPDSIVIEESGNFFHAPGAISISCSIDKDPKKQYSYLSGTSVSAAVTTGAILLLQEAGAKRYPNGVPVVKIREALMSDVFLNGRDVFQSITRPDTRRNQFTERIYADNKKYCCLDIPAAISKLLTR